MNITVYCGSTPGNREIYRQEAAALGRWIGEQGHTLVYGGSNTGMMGAVADAVLAAGGQVIGVIPDVEMIRKRRHPGLTEVIFTDTVSERRSRMIELGDAFIALPGGIGTLDEMTEVISLSQLEIIRKPIIFFNTEGYYEPMRQVLEHIVQNEFGKESYFAQVIFSNDLKVIEGILKEK